MAFVRYQSPDDSSFLVFDQSRFRVDHALFLLRVGPLAGRIAATLDERREWNLAAMKLVEENRRLASCLEWLETLDGSPEVVVLPDLKHEPAIDVVADALIGDGHYEKAFCPACSLEYRPEDVTRTPWSFEEDGVTLRALASTCPRGHTLHVLALGVDAEGLELPDD